MTGIGVAALLLLVHLDQQQDLSRQGKSDVIRSIIEEL